MFSFFRQIINNVLVGIALGLLLGACSPRHSEENLPTPNFPVPTLNPLFYSAPSATSMETGSLATPAPLQNGDITNLINTPATLTSMQIEASLLPGSTPTSTPIPADTPAPTSTITPAPTEVFNRIMVYNEGLTEKWALKYGEQMRYSEKDKTVSHDGAYSFSLKPQADNGQILFAHRQTAKESYLHADTVGVSFWLYGDKEIDPSDLVVSILGSNRFPFWFQGDQSVESDQEPIFPETPVNYLENNQTIPAQTWVQVVIKLADLPDDPDYEYVTGIQIKNDAGFRDQVYIDQVELLMAPAQ